MFKLKTLTILGSKAELASLPEGKLLINTINAHSFNTAKKVKLWLHVSALISRLFSLDG